MKALKYLQKVGAIPAYDDWDIMMSVVVIVTDFFSPDLVIEPDVLEWTQEAESDGDFADRCNAVLFATAGDVRALFPHIHNKPVPFLKGLLESLIDLRLKMYLFANSIIIKDSDKNWFSESYNDMVGLRGNKRFPSKSAIIHSYCSGSLTDAGQEILSNLAGTEKDFEKEIVKLGNKFSNFVSEGEMAEVLVMEYRNEGDNPFAGGFQAIAKVRVPGVDGVQECTLHWAPWPTAKTRSANQILRSICDSFTSMNRREWFSLVEAEE